VDHLQRTSSTSVTTSSLVDSPAIGNAGVVTMTGMRGSSKENGAAGGKLGGKSKTPANANNGSEPGPPLPEASSSVNETLASSVQFPRLIKRNLPFFQSRNRVRIEHNQGWKIMSLLRHDLFHVALRYRTSVSLSTLIFVWTLFLIIFAGKWRVVLPDCVWSITSSSQRCLTVLFGCGQACTCGPIKQPHFQVVDSAPGLIPLNSGALLHFLCKLPQQVCVSLHALSVGRKLHTPHPLPCSIVAVGYTLPNGTNAFFEVCPRLQTIMYFQVSRRARSFAPKGCFRLTILRALCIIDIC
jgi:hypothetical protein